MVVFTLILGDPGADSGGEGKSKRAEKYGTKLVFFWHQSEARTAATVWNWSGKTLGAFHLGKKARKFRWEQKWNFRLVKSCSI